MRRKETFRAFVAAAIACLIASVAYGQDVLKEPIPVDPKIKAGRLPNGLTYYIRKNNRPEKKLELRLVINAGSVLEDDDQQGLAHFTEHMAFNGSKNFKKNDIVSFLQSIGVEFGADLNAYTGFDETVYILPIPTEKKENVEKGFQILEDWASTVAFDASELDKERGVVLEEERLGKGAEDRMFRVTYPKLFQGSKYAERLPIGKAEILKTFKPEAIKRFYADWYKPNLMAVIAVGDIDPAEAERLITKHFAHLKNPASERPRPLVELPGRLQSEAIVVTDPEATQHVIQIIHSYRKTEDDVTVEDYRKSLIRSMFISMLNQRIQELQQQANPPFIFGGSNIGSWARGYEAYSSFAYIGKNGPEPAIKALIQESIRAKKFGFTAAELDRVKKMMMKGVERMYNERDKSESPDLADEYIRNFTDKEVIPGIEKEYEYYKMFVDKITLEEVNQTAARLIPASEDTKLVTLTGPSKADFNLPSNEQLLRMVEEAGAVDVKAYEEKAIATTLIEKLPAKGQLQSEKQISAIGATELVFANGVKVVLKPTDFKNDQIVMTASRFGGHYLYDAAERPSAENAATIVSQMGVGNFSPTDLRKFLAGKSVSVTPRISSVSESINGGASAADIETMLQLTHLYFTAPRNDQELFDSFINKQSALYQNMTSDPEFVFQDSIFRTLYGKHPWAPRVPRIENFAKINKDRVLAIYKERFGNANGFNFVFVGNFDLGKMKELLAQYIGSLPSSPVTSTYKDVGLRAVRGTIEKEVKKGTEPKSYIRMFWNGEAPYSDKEQVKLQALAELMNIKITESLREELSGIYGGAMYANLNKYPYGHYSAGVSLPCGPENVQKLIKATLDEIAKVKASGPLETDLNKVKETWRQQYLKNVKENGFWARQLLQMMENKTKPEEILNYEKKINAITVKDVKDAANKYLDMKNYVLMVLNPEVSSNQN